MHLIVVVIFHGDLGGVFPLCRRTGGLGGDPVAEVHFLVVLVGACGASVLSTAGREETAETAAGSLEVLVSEAG